MREAWRSLGTTPKGFASAIPRGERANGKRLMKIHSITFHIVVSLFSLSLAAAASAQLVPTHPPSLESAMERYDNPPAPPRKMETSRRMISRFDVFTSYQANVDANGQNIL